MVEELEHIRLIQEISGVHVIPYDILGGSHPVAAVESGPRTVVPVISSVGNGFPGGNTARGHKVAAQNRLIFNNRVPVQTCVFGFEYPIRILGVKLPEPVFIALRKSL